MNFKYFLLINLFLAHSDFVFSQKNQAFTELGINNNAKKLSDGITISFKASTSKSLFRIDCIGLPEISNSIFTHTFDSNKYINLQNEVFKANEGIKLIKLPMIGFSLLHNKKVSSNCNLAYGPGFGFKYSYIEENLLNKIDGTYIHPDGSRELVFNFYTTEISKKRSNTYNLWFYSGLELILNSNFYASISIRPNLSVEYINSSIYSLNQDTDLNLKVTPPTIFYTESNGHQYRVLSTALPFISIGYRL